MISIDELRALLNRFRGRRLLVLGDAILDSYWWGESERLSPESAVPIIQKKRVTVRAGGAANAAANIVALGGSAVVIGIVGRDGPAGELKDIIERSGIVHDLLEDSSRPTTTKLRIVAHNRQLLRVDQEETHPLDESLANRVLDSVHARAPECHGIILSDYSKGFLTPYLIRRVMQLASEHGLPIFVDPKGPDAERYIGCSLIKPNRLELAHLTQREIHSHEETLQAGRVLRSRMPGTTVLVTEGADGMTLFLPNGSEHHAESIRLKLTDVTGAGDTVIASISLAVGVGVSHVMALELASLSACVAISGVGTSAVTRQEVEAAWENHRIRRPPPSSSTLMPTSGGL